MVTTPLLALALTGFVLALSVGDVHGVVGALSEAIVARLVVGQDGAVYSRTVVLGDGTDDDSVCAWAGAVVGAALNDGEFEVGFRGVAELELLVVIVCVGVCWECQLGLGLVWSVTDGLTYTCHGLRSCPGRRA